MIPRIKREPLRLAPQGNAIFYTCRRAFDLLPFGIQPRKCSHPYSGGEPFDSVCTYTKVKMLSAIRAEVSRFFQLGFTLLRGVRVNQLGFTCKFRGGSIFLAWLHLRSEVSGSGNLASLICCKDTNNSPHTQHFNPRNYESQQT